MWSLIAFQFRYSRFGLAVAAAVAVAIAVPLTIWFDRPEPTTGIWLLVVLGLGVSTKFLLWTVDQKERRLLLWLALPLRLEEIAVARLLPPLLVQAAVGILAALGMLLAFLVHGHADPRALPGLLGTQGFALVVVQSIYLLEELTLLVSPRRWAVIAVKVAVVAALLIPALNLEMLFNWPGVVLSHGMAAAIAAVVFALFVRRRSFLVGVDPVTGFPRDWSEAPGRGSGGGPSAR